MDSARLQAIPLFADLEQDDLAAVAAAASELSAEKGQTLVNAGEFGHALYAIEAGTATVRADGAVLRTLQAGDVFGEIAVVASGRRTASVVATSPVRLIVLFKRDVWALEQRSPKAAARLRSLIADRQSVAQSS